MKSAHIVLVSLLVFLDAASAVPLLDFLSGNDPPASNPPEVISLLQNIEQVAYGSLNCTVLIDFEDVPGSSDPGTNYDTAILSGDTSFSERFVGQALSIVGNFDVLGSAASNPLTLQDGLPSQNLLVADGPPFGHILGGVGALGYPDPSALGEGAVAMYCTSDQSEVGLRTLAAGGSMTLNFFRRDGSLIDTIVIAPVTILALGFRRAGGLKDIAGVSIHNADAGGLGVDDICHDVMNVVPTENRTWGGIKALYE